MPFACVAADGLPHHAQEVEVGVHWAAERQCAPDVVPASVSMGVSEIQGHLIGVLMIRGILLFGGLYSASLLFVNPPSMPQQAAGK